MQFTTSKGAFHLVGLTVIVVPVKPLATATTAASGGNREELLGPRSDFSKPCQGAAEKSANATRRCCLVRGSHESGMSTGTSAADDPKLRLGVVFYLAEKRGRTARPPDGSYHDMDK